MPWLDIATGQFKDDDDGCVVSGKSYEKKINITNRTHL
jgi:hypothetical protein